MSRILVVEDEASMRQFLQILLTRNGHIVALAGSGEEALEALAEQEFDLVLTDLKLGGVDGLQVLQRTKAIAAETQVIVLTAYATTETAVQAMKAGAYDYVMKPFRVDALEEIVKKALEKRDLIVENMALRRQIHKRYGVGNLIGSSPAIRKVYDLIDRVARTRSNVLIVGESGTGKELVAKAIHYNSGRADQPLVTLNCGAIPENLIESELFGHVRGSFTGAVANRRGFFDEADNSTLFLDEIGELSPTLQVKLLRVLQERKIKPVGGTREKNVDVRLICATNRELEEEVRLGRFREDLYYRINVIQIRLPPLRERKEDIPALTVHFVDHFCRENGRQVMEISSRALAALCSYGFPGNVRELENIVERAVALSTGGSLDLELLPAAVTSACSPAGLPLQALEIPEEGIDLERIVGELERDLLVKALRKTRGVRKDAAELLGITFRSIRYRLDKFGLDDEAVERIARESE
ncbi:MAG: sigma-54-dependent Fis family transcriptional regulator [Deltaproteobacteria bacterium]|nr:sigma-54-dependent Fis family transcriptional regulator [Deltaproteobacteria bacterium]